MNRLLAIGLVGLGLLAASLNAADPARGSVRHSPASPKSGEKVVITLEPAALNRATLEYQVVAPGGYISRKDPRYEREWTAVEMTAAPGGLAAEIPGSAQAHRNLVRYRIRGESAQGGHVSLPDATDTEPNFAYFVYDGVPAWKAAIDPGSADPRKSALTQFPPEVMRQVQTYFLLANKREVENATWYQQSFDKAYRYTGTFVADGKVYDHVQFRARGGEWRYAMGKNMWKFNFNKGRHLEAKDDYGRRYSAKWGKLNLRSCISQGDYGRRGEQGMYEAVGFRLFNLAGADAPRTHFVTLRIVDEKEESPATQYGGDFWGLYLAIENEDGDFLDEHRLPDGNIYKMKFGQGELSNQGEGQPADKSDLQKFLAALRRGGGAEGWWRQNVDMPRYYSYRAIVEAIHHYDISSGKNYDFYLNPKTGKWCVIPWDIDLTWADHMYGGGFDPFFTSLARHPALQSEYQNRLREVRDLLFNPSETDRLIDECAALIYRPGQLSIVDADRCKWDYHPIMDSGHVISGKADKGLFYRGVRSRDFKGMVDQMKAYVIRRCQYIDQELLTDRQIPKTPRIEYTGPQGYPADKLSFKTSAFSGPSKFAAMQWRAGQINRRAEPGRAGHYEITPVWQSDERTEFQEAIQLPALPPGGTYRVRCRMKDSEGKWSHWSDPVEFQSSP